MATETKVSPDVEPTPEFDGRCLAIITGWRNGEIPTTEATQKLKNLAREAQTAAHAANQGRAEHLSGYIQHYLGNYTVSNMYYEKARRLFERIGNRRRVATMDLNMGENYRYRGEFKRARRLYRAAYDTSSALGDTRIQTFAITNEALMLISLDDYTNARIALDEALTLTEVWEAGEQFETVLTEIYYGLAEVDLATNKLSGAWDNAHRALQHAGNSANLHSVGLAYRILGDVLTALDVVPDDARFKNPDEYYRKAIETFKEIDTEAEIARTVFHHAKSLAERGKRRNAAQLLRDAMEIFNKLGMTDDVADAAEVQLRVI
jgi:tetratricopeptide (TPR) repeat protein